MIRVLRDDERLALVRLGRFQGLKGPGIVVCLPIIDRAVRLRVGDTGEVTTCGMASFGGMNIPVTGDDLSESRVRIVGFDDSFSPPRPRVVPV